MKNKLINDEFEKIEKEIDSEDLELRNKENLKEIFPILSTEEILKTLGLTIKKDDENKLITFLCCLSAYTEDDQFNISFNAPSSTGKSYIPLEIVSLFPKEDVFKTAYCSPTAFFHQKGDFIKEREGYLINLDRKILIFLDQPHDLLLQHLRPLLSHDAKEITLKITDKTQRYGLKTKNIFLRGFPSVVFCSAGLKIDEQEATRFILLSPEISQEKLREGIKQVFKKESNSEIYLKELNNDPLRQNLKERIKAIKEIMISEIRIHNPEMIKNTFLSMHKNLKPRHQRDAKRLSSIIKSFALLNLWHRKNEGPILWTSDNDIEEGFKIWEGISVSQEFNLPPYIYNFLYEVIVPLYQEKQEGLTRKDILMGHYRIYQRPLAEWKLRREIIPELETAGLITQEKDPDDKRNILIYPVCSHSTPESTLSRPENIEDCMGG
ncbi:MAG: hypothetical protein PHE84_04250 [bacterium]|nr:hypothetical protein [bacterium]